MQDPPSRLHARRWTFHDVVDGALVGLLTLSGFLCPESPAAWFESLGFSFAVLAVPILAGAAAVTWLSRHLGMRIQGPRTMPARIAREAFETTRAMYVAACLMAWPLTLWRLGHPTGLIWRVGDVGLGWVLVQTLVGVLLIDAWLYWKHRLLHTRSLFGFHKGHHVFRDPTPFAGFAVGPVEALLTFWPILLICLPQATHWAPLYFGLIVAFINLNFYLHCGVTIGWVEKTLSPALLNTSAFHNVHHSHVNVHFGEALIVWDIFCGTRLADRKPG